MSQTFVWPELLQTPDAGVALAFEQARQSGYQTGLVEGREAAEAEIVQLRLNLVESIAEVDRSKTRFQQLDQQAMVRLLEALMEALIGVELRTNDRIIGNLVAQAMTEMSAQRDQLTLTVGPDDAAATEANIKVEIDPEMPPGKVLVDNGEMELIFDPIRRLAELMEQCGVDADALLTAD